MGFSPVCGAGARCTMLALAGGSLLVCANGSRLPASSEQVMPKLHLAYLVEDVEYPRPEELQASNEELPHSSRVKRQSSPLAVNNQQVEAGAKDIGACWKKRRTKRCHIKSSGGGQRKTNAGGAHRILLWAEATKRTARTNGKQYASGRRDLRN